MYTTFLFDLDGTLLNTLDDLHAAVNAALQAYSLPLRSKEEVRGFVGNGIAKLMERAVGDAPKEISEGAFAFFKDYYERHCKDATKPYDGILHLLSALRERGAKCAVLSNKADFAVKLLAEAYFPSMFEAAVGEKESEGIRKKPAPDALFAVMDELGVKAAECVYIGDSEVDIQTAKNADVDCISVTWGFKGEAFLRANGATELVHEPSEILRYCKA